MSLVSYLNLFSPVSLVLDLPLPLESILVVTLYTDVSVSLCLFRVTHKCFQGFTALGVSKGTLFFPLKSDKLHSGLQELQDRELSMVSILLHYFVPMIDLQIYRYSEIRHCRP